jgi:hypothetical protein
MAAYHINYMFHDNPPLIALKYINIVYLYVYIELFA